MPCCVDEQGTGNMAFGWMVPPHITRTSVLAATGHPRASCQAHWWSELRCGGGGSGRVDEWGWWCVPRKNCKPSSPSCLVNVARAARLLAEGQIGSAQGRQSRNPTTDGTVGRVGRGAALLLGQLGLVSRAGQRDAAIDTESSRKRLMIVCMKDVFA
ncbi:unnamed protein product, partial [Protopolystoma xenopodis]